MLKYANKIMIMDVQISEFFTNYIYTQFSFFTFSIKIKFTYISDHVAMFIPSSEYKA